MWSIFRGFPPPFPPLLFTVILVLYQCHISVTGSWLGCQTLPVIGSVSILELAAANSGSSKMSGTQPPQSDALVKAFLQCQNETLPM